ncbi:MAG: hypothetical protein ACLS36_08105 [Streptococcus sp.]
MKLWNKQYFAYTYDKPIDEETEVMYQPSSLVTGVREELAQLADSKLKKIERRLSLTFDCTDRTLRLEFMKSRHLKKHQDVWLSTKSLKSQNTLMKHLQVH